MPKDTTPRLTTTLKVYDHGREKTLELTLWSDGDIGIEEEMKEDCVFISKEAVHVLIAALKELAHE